MKRLMNILILSCLKASELIEKKQLFGLNIMEKIQLHIHKKMCDACNSYEIQSIIISASLKNSHLHAPISNESLDILKSDILKKLEDK